MTMKKLFLMLIAVIFGVVAATAQDEKPRKLTKQERKALRERIDSLKYAQAEGSIMDSMFVLEADEVVFKRGYTAHVTYQFCCRRGRPGRRSGSLQRAVERFQRLGRHYRRGACVKV